MYLWYNLFSFLIEFRKPSEIQGFLFEYFFRILISGKHLSCRELSIEWKWLNEFWVSGMLQISVQSTTEIASLNFWLFFSLTIRVTKNDSVSSTVMHRLIWKIGKWSETSATRIPPSEQFRLSWLFVDMISMRVADLLVILVGREISGRNSLQYMTSTNAFVKSCVSELNRSIL